MTDNDNAPVVMQYHTEVRLDHDAQQLKADVSATMSKHNTTPREAASPFQPRHKGAWSRDAEQRGGRQVIGSSH